MLRENIVNFTKWFGNVWWYADVVICKLHIETNKTYL